VRRYLTLGAGLVVSAFFAWLAFRSMDSAALFDAFGEIQLIYLPLAVLVYFVAAYLLGWRWHFLLRPIQTIHPHRLTSLVFIGYMGNNIYPARIGELIRAYVLKRRYGVAYAPSLAVILVERVFDGLVLVSFVLLASRLVIFEDALLRTVITFTTPVFFGGVAVFVFFALRPDRAQAIYQPLIKRLTPARLRPKLLHLADTFMQGLLALRDPRLLALTFAASFASWTIEASTYWIVLRAFDFEVSFFVLMLVMGLANLTTILPSTPGYVGTFHGVVVLTLTAFGVADSTAGAYALVMHMVLWLPVTVTGAILLLAGGLSWADLNRASHIKEEG